jgi:hypothetical protein
MDGIVCNCMITFRYVESRPQGRVFNEPYDSRYFTIQRNILHNLVQKLPGFLSLQSTSSYRSNALYREANHSIAL